MAASLQPSSSTAHQGHGLQAIGHSRTASRGGGLQVKPTASRQAARRSQHRGTASSPTALQHSPPGAQPPGHRRTASTARHSQQAGATAHRPRGQQITASRTASSPPASSQPHSPQPARKRPAGAAKPNAPAPDTNQTRPRANQHAPAPA